MFLRPVHLDRLHRNAILRTVAGARGPVGNLLRRASRSRRLAEAERKTGRGVQDQEPRRMVQGHGRHRHLFRAYPDHAGSPQASAHGCARDVRHPPRRHPTRTSPALFAHAFGDPGAGKGGDGRSSTRVERGKVSTLNYSVIPRSGLLAASRRMVFNQVLVAILRGSQELAPQDDDSPCKSARRDLRRVIHLQHTAPDLVFLDRLAKRLEISLAKAVVALALDELEEYRADCVRREDLQQHLGVAAVDDAFTVDQDAVPLQARDVLAMLRQPRIDLLEIGLGRRRHEWQAISAQRLDGSIDVLAAASDVLDTLAAIDVEIFLDLPGIAGILVDRNPNLA